MTNAGTLAALTGLSLSGTNSVFPGPQGAVADANGNVVQLGGGLDYRLTPRASMHLLHTGWLRTNLPNATSQAQNSMTLGSGMFFRF